MNTVPPGRHPNWCKCAGCRNDIARFESAQFKGTLIALAAIAVPSGIIWLLIWVAHSLA